MRGKKVKMIRLAVYGHMSPRFKKYSRLGNGMVIADGRRRKYQNIKRLMVSGPMYRYR